MLWAIRLIGAATSGLMAVAIPAAVADSCDAVVVGEFGGSPPARGATARRPRVELVAAGNHCLADDIHQGKLWDSWRRRELVPGSGKAVVLIGADGVRLDLRGHTVSNDRAPGYTLARHYQDVPGHKHSHWFSRTEIRNGFLFSPGSKGIGLEMISAGRHAPGFGTPAAIPPGLGLVDVFRDTSHLIETLNIRAGKRAILIDGRNNVIRNNRIMVDAITAIVAQGPGLVIENNVIEVRSDLEALTGHDRRLEAQAPFVIRLIQADDAIIRNNEFRLLDRAGRRPLAAAIELVQTKGALLQGNIFGGMEALVQADGSSSFQEEGSSMEPCPAGAARYLAPDEANEAGRLRLPACR